MHSNNIVGYPYFNFEDFDRTPEFSYTLACLGAELSQRNELPAPPDKLDWSLWLSFLNAHLLASHFYTLSHQDPDRWPGEIREELRRSRYAHLLYGDALQSQIKTLLECLHRASIPVIVLKGWTLIQSLYNGDYGQRFCQDIDLLIKPRDVNTVEDLFTQQGYMPEPEVWPGSARRYSNGRNYFAPGSGWKNKDGLVISLHWGLFHFPCYDPARVAVGPLFDQTDRIDIAGQMALKLRDEDEIAYLCAHIDLHHRTIPQLRDFFEIACLINRAGQGFDMTAVFKRAAGWQHILPVKRVLSTISHLWPWVIQTDDLEGLNAYPVSQKELREDHWLTKSFGNKALLTGLMILTLPGWIKKLGYIFEQVFPSPGYIRARYHTSSLLKTAEAYFLRYFDAASSFLKSKRFRTANGLQKTYSVDT